MEPLDYLAWKNNCYLSDLRAWKSGRVDFMPLLLLPPETFTLEGWNRLLAYLFPGSPPCGGPGQAWALLAARLTDTAS